MSLHFLLLGFVIAFVAAAAFAALAAAVAALAVVCCCFFANVVTILAKTFVTAEKKGYEPIGIPRSDIGVAQVIKK